MTFYAKRGPRDTNRSLWRCAGALLLLSAALLAGIVYALLHREHGAAVPAAGTMPPGESAAASASALPSAVEGEPMDPLILVNFENPCPDVIPGGMVCADTALAGVLTVAREGIWLDARCAAALADMLEAARDEGVDGWILSSGYRDHDYQRRLYERKLEQDPHYADDPYAHPVAVMPPYVSEHATGLAVDLTIQGYESLEEDFAATVQGIWLLRHCAAYGFILRYPADKESVTGVVYEPWHFRYVGSPEVAGYIMENGLCLEEYLAQLPE